MEKLNLENQDKECALFYNYLLNQKLGFTFSLDDIKTAPILNGIDIDRVFDLAKRDKIIARSDEIGNYHLRKKATTRSPKTVAFLKGKEWVMPRTIEKKKRQQAREKNIPSNHTVSFAKNYQRLLEVSGKNSRKRRPEKIDRSFLFEESPEGETLTGSISPKRNIENRNKYDNKAALGLKDDLERIRKERELFGMKD